MAIHEGYLIKETRGICGEKSRFSAQIDFILKSEADAVCGVFTQGSETMSNREAVILFGKRNKDFEKITSFDEAAKQLSINEKIVIRVKNLRLFQLYKNIPA